MFFPICRLFDFLTPQHAFRRCIIALQPLVFVLERRAVLEVRRRLGGMTGATDRDQTDGEHKACNR